MGYVFISYSSKDQRAADTARQLFGQIGVKTWMAPYDIPAGSAYAKVIIDALKGCSCMALLLTENAQQSVWVVKEVERAINFRKTVVTIQLEDLILNQELELYLCNQQVVKVRSICEDSPNMQRIFDAISILTNGKPASVNEERTVLEKEFIKNVKSSLSGTMRSFYIQISDITDNKLNDKWHFSVLLEKPLVSEFPKSGEKPSVVKSLTSCLKQKINVLCGCTEADVQVQESSLEIEIPCGDEEPINFGKVFQAGKGWKLPVPIGFDGGLQTEDLAKIGHILVFGSADDCANFCNCSIVSLCESREDVKIALFDLRLNLSDFPHMKQLYGGTVYQDRVDLEKQLGALCAEMDRRYALMADRHGKTRCVNIGQYNEISSEKLPRIVVMINGYLPDQRTDELLTRLLCKSRACGIHILLARVISAQSEPPTEILPSTVSASFPIRMIFQCPYKLRRALLSEPAIASRRGVVCVRSNFFESAYTLKSVVADDAYMQAFREKQRDDELPPLLTEEEHSFAAVVVQIAEIKRVSISLLQRKFSMGYNKATHMMDLLCAKGFADRETGTVTVPPETVEEYRKLLDR